MAKKTIVRVKKAPAANTELELRRWCIEQAIRWPTENYQNGFASVGGGMRTDVDIIGRAKRLRDWVTSAT